MKYLRLKKSYMSTNHKLGIRDMVDDVNIQGWPHLFEWPILMLYEKEVQEFYYNIGLNSNGSINTVVNNQLIHLDEDWLDR